MLESIVAIDGSVLDFVNIQDAYTKKVYEFMRTVYRDRGNILYGECLASDFQAVKNSKPNMWFIQKRGCEGYVGVCYYGTAEGNAWVSMETAISQEWRLNGYGRAAFTVMCEHLSHLADDHKVVVSKGKHDGFCKGLGMHQNETMWSLPLKEVLCA